MPHHPALVAGRTAVITGGASGIGLAAAKRYAGLGMKVVIADLRQEALEAAAKEIAAVPGSPGEVLTVACDVSRRDDVEKLKDAAYGRFGEVAVLMNNAGIAVTRNLKVPADDLAGLPAEMDVNVSGVIRTTSALIDILTANRGTVINVSSALAFVPVPAMPIYSATKAAVHSYTQSLRFQLEESGVEVIELMPPAVKTDLASDFAEAGFKLITTAELVGLTIAALKAGKREIRPGQSNLVALMRRIAPDVINQQFWKASRKLVPGGAS